MCNFIGLTQYWLTYGKVTVTLCLTAGQRPLRDFQVPTLLIQGYYRPLVVSTSNKMVIWKNLHYLVGQANYYLLISVQTKKGCLLYMG